MTTESKNTIWYAVGAASSVVFAVGIMNYLNPDIGRFPLDPMLGSLLLVTYGLIAALLFALYRKFSTCMKKFHEGKISHFVPLVLGFSFAPIFFGTGKIIDLYGDWDRAFWIALFVPIIIGFEGLRIAYIFRPKGEAEQNAGLNEMG